MCASRRGTFEYSRAVFPLPTLDSKRLGGLGDRKVALDVDGALGPQQHHAGDNRQQRDPQRPPVGDVEGVREAFRAVPG